MIQIDWVDFIIEDLTWNKTNKFTQDTFEELVGDKFEAVELEDGVPKYIWTTKFCFVVITLNKFTIGSPAIIGVPRNPKY